jgi:hypothetical protein
MAYCHVVGLLPGIHPVVVGTVQFGLKAAGRAADLSHPGGHDPFMGDFPWQFTATHDTAIPVPGPVFVNDVHGSLEYHAAGGRRWPI